MRRSLLDQTEQNGQAQQGKKAARVDLSRMVDLQEHATEQAKQILQSGVETASGHARDASERLTKTLGFSGSDSERLARQYSQNMEIIARCGNLLGQALQDASRNWFQIGQKQWQRNLDGVNRLTRSASVQEFAAVQSELVREGVEQVVRESREIAEASLRAVDEASRSFSPAPRDLAAQAH